MELFNWTIQAYDDYSLKHLLKIALSELWNSNDQWLKRKIHRAVNSFLGVPMVMFITEFHLF